MKLDAQRKDLFVIASCLGVLVANYEREYCHEGSQTQRNHEVGCSDV